MTPRVIRMVSERFHRDEEGRPIREGRTPKEHLRPGDIEYKPCPYSGARHHHELPMNVSALRQMSAHWSEMLDTLAVLREGYAAARGAYGPDVMDLWRVSQVGNALPWWFIVRDRPVPAHVAALAKATIGAGVWTQQLLLRELAGTWTAPAFTAANMLESAEETGTLIGTAEVCAGSEKMIERYFQAYLDRGPGTGEIAAIADDVLRFGAHYTGFKLLLWLGYLARRYLLWDLGTPAAHALLAEPCEPPDFFVLEPAEAAQVAPVHRAAWLARLAGLVVPFAPDGSDAVYAEGAKRIARVLGEGAPPARAFAKLDAIAGIVVAAAEAGLGGDPAEITVEVRDALVASGTRAAFANAGGA